MCRQFTAPVFGISYNYAQRKYQSNFWAEKKRNTIPPLFTSLFDNIVYKLISFNKSVEVGVHSIACNENKNIEKSKRLIYSVKPKISASHITKKTLRSQNDLYIS